MGTSKVKNIEKKNFTNQTTGKSSSSITISLEDGVGGYLDEKTSDKDLNVGDEVFYQADVKTNKKGGTYNLITATKTDKGISPQQSGADNRSERINTGSVSLGNKKHLIEELKVEASIRSMEAVMDAYKAERVGCDWDAVPAKTKELSTLLCSEIDDIFK